jgi:hypothetical protein
MVSFVFPIVLMTVWLVGMGSLFYFSRHVAPAALQRWADEEGYRVIQRKNAGPFAWWSFAKGNCHWVYRVVLVDKVGQEREALVRVGHPALFCLSVSRCPVDVRWKEAKASASAVLRPLGKMAMWDRDLD